MRDGTTNILLRKITELEMKNIKRKASLSLFPSLEIIAKKKKIISCAINTFDYSNISEWYDFDAISV